TAHEYPLVASRLRLGLNARSVLARRHRTQFQSARDDIANGEPLEFQRARQIPVVTLVESPDRRRVLEEVAQGVGILASVEVVDGCDADGSQAPVGRVVQGDQQRSGDS